VTGNPSDEIVKKTVEDLGFVFKGRVWTQNFSQWSTVNGQ
jgi:hypothetical protein